MPLQAAFEAAPARVTPAPGKGALGTRWPRQSGTHQTQSWVTRGLHRGEGARQTPPRRGEGCASTAVSRAGGRPALRNGVQSRGQNRTREIRPSGIVEGLQETWPVGALISTRRARLISISTIARPGCEEGRASQRARPIRPLGQSRRARLLPGESGLAHQHDVSARIDQRGGSDERTGSEARRRPGLNRPTSSERVETAAILRHCLLPAVAGDCDRLGLGLEVLAEDD